MAKIRRPYSHQMVEDTQVEITYLPVNSDEAENYPQERVLEMLADLTTSFKPTFLAVAQLMESDYTIIGIEEQIEGCPFCDSNDYALSEVQELYYVECKNCKARGPLANSDTKAYENWNRRV